MAKKAKIGTGTPQVAMKVKPPEDYQPISTKKDKQEKEGGLQYVLDDIWFVAGAVSALKAGSVFKECNDGWFQAYNDKGEKMWYRVSPKIIKEVFEAKAGGSDEA